MARSSLADRRDLDRKAYIITGPTSGIGLRTAFELARHGTVVLVGRNPRKLAEVRQAVERKGGRAVSVVCDLSDMASVRRAADQVVALGLPVVGLLNNAGIFPSRTGNNARGWDLTFATNHLGPFLLTEALAPHLPDGANVVFIVSAVEDPGRGPAVAFGFRGGRYISAEASARGEWEPGGSSKPGFDAYATSKQAALATVREFARETPRLRFYAIEPGLTPATALGGEGSAFLRLVQRFIMPLLVPLFMPFMRILSTPKRSGRMISGILVNASAGSGTYFDERGRSMEGSLRSRDPAFTRRVVAETRALLAAETGR